MRRHHRAGAIYLLLLLGAAGCSTRGGPVPSPFPRPGVAPDPAPSIPSAGLIDTALALQGAPYVWGGVTPSGFDCSGFTRYVFAQHGVRLPRTAAEQYRAGRRIGPNDLRPGDLVFFTTIAPGPSHVGLALGDGRFVHAPNEQSAVRIDELDARYWRRRFLGARRIVS